MQVHAEWARANSRQDQFEWVGGNRIERFQVSFVFPPQRPGATSFRGPFVILPKADIQATTTTTATAAANERSTGTCQIRNGRIKQCCITHGYRIRRPP